MQNVAKELSNRMDDDSLLNVEMAAVFSLLVWVVNA